jgi:hypothetical protein
MTELFREGNISPENNHETNGTIEVEYRNGASITLQTAEQRPAWTDEYEPRVDYNVLVNSVGYELDPYTIFKNDELKAFGDGLEETLSAEGMLALHSKRHALDLGFRAIVGSEPWGGLLERNIISRHRKDSDSFTLQLETLIEEDGYDLWVRLETRQRFRDVPREIIIARLAYMSATKDDKVTMVPVIRNHDGTRRAAIPEQLAFGDPWLYVGAKYHQPKM